MVEGKTTTKAFVYFWAMDRFATIALLFLLELSVGAQVNPCRPILDEMISTVQSAETFEYQVRTSERVDNKMTSSSALVKNSAVPFRIYMKILEPEDGPEILYCEDKYNGQAVVNPNGFPYINLKLNPDGYFMRKDHHHNIKTAGFGYIAGMMLRSQEIAGENYDKYFKYKGDTVFLGEPCVKIAIDVFDFKYEDYTVKKDETIIDIAERLYLNDYLIVDKNEDVDDFEDIDEGDVIKLPNAYGRRIYLLIHKGLKVPYYQEIHDELGLYEKYYYDYVKLNVPFDDSDFSTDNPEYGF